MKTAFYYENPDDPRLLEDVQLWQREFPEGQCLALVAESVKDCIPQLQNQFNDLNYPLNGAMFPELIYNAEFKKQGVLLLFFKQAAFSCLMSEIPVDEDMLDSTIDAFSSKIQSQNLKNGNKSLFLIFDGMLANIGTILERLYFRFSNSFNYFGVNAGSETFQSMPCLFNNNEFIANGLLAILLSEYPEAVVAHNYQEPDMEITATSADGNCINSIDWKPAFDVYQEMVKQYYGVDITRENFYQYAVHFPFGISRMDGQPLVRIPVALQDDGSIFCVGEIPPNTLLTLLNAIEPGSSDTIDAIAQQTELAIDGILLNFYCAGRRMHLGDAAIDELNSLGKCLDKVTIAGAISLGEIGSSSAGGYPLFHNAALVAIPWNNS